MKIKSSAIVPLLALMYGSGSGAQEKSSFFTGQGWAQQMPSEMRIGYIVGYLDGYDLALAFAEAARASKSGPQDIIRSSSVCWHKMTFGQLEAIVDKAVKDHPETWDKDTAVLAADALTSACLAQNR
jgi:hypothetical protein